MPIRVKGQTGPRCTLSRHSSSGRHQMTVRLTLQATTLPIRSSGDWVMPAIVPPVDEIAIGHQFPGCKQDHQYTRRHAAYRSRYRLVADCPRCNQQSQTEEKLSPLLQIGRNDKSLYGKQNDEQPKHDGYPGSRPGEAQTNGEQPATRPATGWRCLANVECACCSPPSLFVII